MRKFTFLLLACCFTFMANAQVFVKPASDGGSDSKDGFSWDNAKATVASAIPVAKAADVKEVWVKKGTYTDVWGTTFQNNNIGGVSVYGGFAGTETSIDQRTKGSSPWGYTNETIITFNVPGIGFNSVVNPDTPCLIEGFSFKNGTATGTVGARNNVTFKNCIWANNSLTTTMVTFYVTGSNGPARIIECLFENNTATNGNTIQLNPTNGSAVIDKCLFVGNTSTTHQVLALGKSSYVTNCVLYNNEAKGSIINAGNAAAEVVNCLVYNNKADNSIVNISGLLVNSTIANNQSKAGVMLAAVTGKVYNTILNGNFTSTDEPVSIVGNFAAEVKNCAFSGILSTDVVGANNLVYAKNNFPAFVSPSTFVGLNKDKVTELAATDWTLTNKPHGLINGGDNTFFDLATYGKEPMNDLAGKARVQNDKIDLGAYESANAAPALPVLTIAPATGGTVTGQGGAYRMGEGILLSATQASGSQFKDWTNNAGSVVSTTPDFTYEMPEASVTLTANFETATEQFTLTVTAGTNGSVSSAGGKYYPGEKLALTATPNDGYVFAAWTDNSGKVISKENPYTLTMEKKDTTIVAAFKYHLTRYLINPNKISEDDEPMEWAREAQTGETIINLNKVMVDNTETVMGLDEFFKGGYWPSPLGAGDEIWLLGTEYQTNETIQILEPGVLIYGGFAGDETSVNQRARFDIDENGIQEPWEFENQTILAGQMISKDINQSVLRLNADDIVADGLVIEGGRQSAGIDYGVGVDLGLRTGGVSGAIMRNSVIRKNLVTGGGSSSVYVCGVYITGNSTLESCLVENNVMDSSNKGPSYAAGVSSGAGTKVINCVIRNNRNEGQDKGNNHGGGLKLGGELTNCVIQNNTALRGGGVYAIAGDNTSINYCTIVNNKAISTVEESKTSVSGGGVYFRGIQGTDKGGVLLNSIVWNNACTDDVVGGENIYIQGGGSPDPRKEKTVILGANAYNGGSAVKADNGDLYYTAAGGNESSISNLSMTGVFVKPIEIVGSNETERWECDWRPLLAGLNIAVPQAENEKDILGYPRPESGAAIGAYQFGSTTGIISNYKKTLDPFVYCSEGKLRVNHSEPVSVEVYTMNGVMVANAAATTHEHEFTLSKGQLYVVVVRCGDLKYSTKAWVK